MPTLDLQVGADSDDCMYRPSDSYFSFNAQAFWAGDYSVAYPDNGSAARFLNVTIPQGSIIDVAYLTLQANVADSGTVVRTRIRAEDTDNAATFSDIANFTARAWTTAAITWNAIAAWATDDINNSPSIVTLVQEVIDRPGFASGNAVVILWDDWQSLSDTGATRSGNAYNNNTAKAPKLHIEYTPPLGRSVGYIIG